MVDQSTCLGTFKCKTSRGTNLSYWPLLNLTRHLLFLPILIFLVYYLSLQSKCLLHFFFVKFSYRSLLCPCPKKWYGTNGHPEPFSISNYALLNSHLISGMRVLRSLSSHLRERFLSLFAHRQQQLLLIHLVRLRPSWWRPELIILSLTCQMYLLESHQR